MRSEPWSPAVNRHLRVGAFLVVAALASLAGFYWNLSDPIFSVAEDPAHRLMLMSLPDLGGKSQAFSQWRGKVLVVNFWATWCGPCREEIPELMKVQRNYASKSVQIVGIAIDNAANVTNYAEEIGIDYVLLVGTGATLGIAKDLGNRAGVLPFTVVLDRSGNLAHAYAGALTEIALGRLLAPLL